MAEPARSIEVGETHATPHGSIRKRAERLQQLLPGTPVAVRTRFTARWTTGFVVEGPESRSDASQPGGRAPEPSSGALERGPSTSEASPGSATYRVRRASDGAILPVAFAAQDLRPLESA